MKRSLFLVSLSSLFLLVGCTSAIQKDEQVNPETSEDQPKGPSTRKEYLDILNKAVDIDFNKADLQLDLAGSLSFDFNLDENDTISIKSDSFLAEIKANNLPLAKVENEEFISAIGDINFATEMTFEDLQLIATNSEEDYSTSISDIKTSLYFDDYSIYLDIPNEISSFAIDNIIDRLSDSEFYDKDKIKELLNDERKFKYVLNQEELPLDQVVDFLELRTYASMYFKIYNEIYSEIFEFSGKDDKFAAKIPLNYSNIKFLYDLHKSEDAPILEEEDFKKFFRVTEGSYIQLNFTSTAVESLDICATGNFDIDQYNILTSDTEETSEVGYSKNINFTIDASLTIPEYTELIFPEDLESYKDLTELINTAIKIKERFDSLDEEKLSDISSII